MGVLGAMDFLQVAVLVLQALTLAGVVWGFTRLGILLFGRRGSNGSTYWRFKVENGTDRAVTARFRLAGNRSGYNQPGTTYHLPAQVDPPVADERYEMVIPSGDGEQFPEYEPSAMTSVVSAKLYLELPGGAFSRDIDIPAQNTYDTIAAIDVRIVGMGIAGGPPFFANITKLQHVRDEGALVAYGPTNYSIP